MFLAASFSPLRSTIWTVFSRYQPDYDSSHSHTSNKYYSDTYSNLQSPEKVHSLDYTKRNQSNILQSQLNDLNSSVYGTTKPYDANNVYNSPNYKSFTQSAPGYDSSHYAALNTSPKPFGSPTYTKSFNYSQPVSAGEQFGHQTNLEGLKPGFVDVKGGNDFSTSEYSTNTYKTPGGYRTDTFKYETYKTSSEPQYSSATEKFYTSTPGGKVGESSPFEKKSFETFKNGGGDSQFQSSYSTNVEYINEPPVLKDDDTLEQKMLKKSVTQQIIEKRTVSTSKTSKQESSTKSFRFE